MRSVSLAAAFLAMTPMISLAQNQQGAQQSQQSMENRQSMESSQSTESSQGRQDPSCIRDVRYSQEFLARYPKLPAACTRVVEKDGKKWVRFAANVVKVRSANVTTNLTDRYGRNVGTLTLRAPSDARVLVRGRELPYSLLRPGDKLALWMPETSPGFYAEPDTSAASHLVIVTMRQWGRHGRNP